MRRQSIITPSVGSVCRAVALVTALCSGVWAQGTFISQDYIDTTIQRAFFNLNAAMGIAGQGFGQKEAISDAKKTVQRLKALAANDPNEKYILWKVSELEYQLFLEENDILMGEYREKQNLLNSLVNQFNAEIGKTYPDFTRLYSFANQMGLIEGSKGDETDYLVRKRARNVSQDILIRAENALTAQDYDAARQELDYCLANRKYLDVPASAYGRFEARLRSGINVDDVRRYLSADAAQVAMLLARNELAPVPAIVSAMNRRLETIRPETPLSEYNRFVLAHERFLLQHTTKEDSLVALVLGAWETRGKAVAKSMLATLLPGHGVKREKIAAIDQRFLDAAARETQKERSIHAEEIATLGQADNAQSGLSDFADLKRKARKIAQARIDSVKAVMETRARVALEDWRKKNARLVRKEGELIKKIEQTRADSRNALMVLCRAYVLEEDQIRSKYADKPAKGNIKIGQLHNSFSQTHLKAVQQFKARLLELETHYDQNRAQQTPRPDLRSHPELASRLANLVPKIHSPDLFDFSYLETSTLPALTHMTVPDHIAGRHGLSAQEKALLVVEDIYRLIEQEKTEIAFAAFNRKKDELQRLVFHEAFLVLKNTVEQAHFFASDSAY